VETTATTTKETSMSNLSRQFDGMAHAYEQIQRKRYARKTESGFVGTGFGWGAYPYMVGATAVGNVTQTQSSDYENPVQELAENNASESTETANTGSGMGEGGTAATGAAGGGMP